MVPLSEHGAYVSRLIGTPWERKGLHCWRIVDQVQRDLFGRAVPDPDVRWMERADRIALLSRSALDFGWIEVQAPEHGAVVRMYRQGGNPADLEHAGVCLCLGGPPEVLHSDHPHGVVLDGVSQLTTLRGWIPRWFVPIA